MTSSHLPTGKRSRGRKGSPLHSALCPLPLPSPPIHFSSIFPFPPSESEGIRGLTWRSLLLWRDVQSSHHPHSCFSFFSSASRLYSPMMSRATTTPLPSPAIATIPSNWYFFFVPILLLYLCPSPFIWASSVLIVLF